MLLFKNGAKFEGDIQKCSKLNGKGKFTFPNGSYYQGIFAEGKINGEGDYYDAPN